MPKPPFKLTYWQEDSVKAARVIRETFAKEQVVETIDRIMAEPDPKLAVLGVTRLLDMCSHSRYSKEHMDALLDALKSIALPPEERDEYLKQQERQQAELAMLESIFEITEKQQQRQAYIESLSGFRLVFEEEKLSERARELRRSIEACVNEEEQERLKDELAEVEEEIRLCQTFWRGATKKRR